WGKKVLRDQPNIVLSLQLRRKVVLVQFDRKTLRKFSAWFYYVIGPGVPLFAWFLYGFEALVAAGFVTIIGVQAQSYWDKVQDEVDPLE
ncbi:MAG: hypothetical protein ACRBB0_27245, partial [Pelagimonas sp.]|uniref:hypothetical protein n=1 Tax=Pelagimonas sp. TaxID=2073170 RepID=UPI003D6ACCA7